MSCSGKIAVHSCPLLCLQGQVAKFASGLFYCWSSLCNNNMATNLLMFTFSYDIRSVATSACWVLNADVLAGNAVRQRLLIEVSKDSGERWYSGFNFSYFDLPFPTRYCIPFVRSGLYQLVIPVKGFRVSAHDLDSHCIRFCPSAWTPRFRRVELCIANARTTLAFSAVAPSWSYFCCC